MDFVTGKDLLISELYESYKIPYIKDLSKSLYLFSQGIKCFPKYLIQFISLFINSFPGKALMYL